MQYLYHLFSQIWIKSITTMHIYDSQAKRLKSFLNCSKFNKNLLFSFGLDLHLFQFRHVFIPIFQGYQIPKGHVQKRLTIKHNEILKSNRIIGQYLQIIKKFFMSFNILLLLKNMDSIDLIELKIERLKFGDNLITGFDYFLI